MDITYTDSSHKDVNILEFDSIDYDYAVMKDFEIVMASSDIIPEEKSWIYCENTEIFGIVEKICPSESGNVVTISGRNTRGILDNKCLEYSSVTIYVEGNASDQINEWLRMCNVDELYICDKSQVDIPYYTLQSQCTLYEAIERTLDSVDSRPTFSFNRIDKKIHIGIELKEDRTDELNFDSNNSFNYSVEVNGSGINHYCISGTDDSGILYKIHVFTDENGGILPYTKTDVPLKDEDYILDKSQQILFGLDEIYRSEVVDSISVTTNYEILQSKPSDWKTSAAEYFIQDTDGNFKKISGENEYIKITSEPENWNEEYSSYYQMDDNGKYTSVHAKDVYKRVYSKPKNWASTYDDYYEGYSDGVTDSYKSVAGVNYYQYRQQTRRPTDWSSNYTSYYKKVTKHKKTKYVKVTKGKKIPKWTKRKYYTRISKEKAPVWKATTKYYIKSESGSVPAWKAGTYYSKRVKAPEWSHDKYYKKVLDHYASIVQKAVEKLKAERITQTAKFEIEDFDASIGDLVGFYSEVLDQQYSEEVSNIIYKCSDGKEKIEVKVGD